MNLNDGTPYALLLFKSFDIPSGVSSQMTSKRSLLTLVFLQWLCQLPVIGQTNWLTSKCSKCNMPPDNDLKQLHSRNEWISRTYAEFSNVKIAIFPLGSVEQHGLHLPVGTDLLLAQAFADAVASPEVLKLPASPFGASFEHNAFSGTVAIPDDALETTWASVINSIAKTGIRIILLLNSHGGQTPNAQLVARRARFQSNPPVLVVVVNLQALIHDAAAHVVTATEHGSKGFDWNWESKHGIHGGLVETSLMLHLFPDLVHQQNMMRFNPRPVARLGVLEPYGNIISYGWETQDIAQCGALGDASRATANLGKEIFQRSSNHILRLVDDLQNTPIDELLLRRRQNSYECSKI
jgi:creatinine amidohydrolase